MENERQSLSNWIIDTISEGGYSFKELYEYIMNKYKNDSEFFDHIKNLLQHQLIEVYISAPHSSHKILLDKTNQMASIDNYFNIVELESKIGSRHYFDLTANGLKYLQKQSTAI